MRPQRKRAEVAWLKGDVHLQNALQVSAPPVPLHSIHLRARARVARERLQRAIFGLAAAVALTLSIHGIQKPATEPFAVPVPMPAPAPAPTIS